MKKLILLIIILFVQFSFAQIPSAEEKKLNDYTLNHQELRETIRIELSNVPLAEYLRTVGTEHEINLYADDSLTDLVTTNFYDLPVHEVFAFLIKKFDLVIETNNQVLAFKKRPEEVKPPEVKPEKKIDVKYNKQNEFLSVNLQNDSLPKVAKAITDASGKNIVLAPEVKGEKVSAYMLNRPFDQVMEMLTRSNGLVVTQDENGFYYIQKDEAPKEVTTSGNSTRRGTRKAVKSGAEISLLDNGFLKIEANDADATPMIMEVASLLHANYVFYDKPDKVKVSLTAGQITFEDLLDHMFKGTEFTFKTSGDFYMVGKRESEGLRSREFIQLENRTMETVIKELPKEITEKVQIKQFKDLNGIMASGSRPNIAEVKDYIQQLDKVVPLVQIEIMIVQYQKSHEVQTGLQAILDKANTQTTGGTLFPTTNVTLNSTTVNDLIDAFNGYGLFKLGKVTKDFYLTLSALETNSIIKTESTPNIATLSGSDATLKIGEQTWYFQQNNQIFNTGVNNTITQSGQWKSLDADLSVEIKPIVSRDEHVTLEITVENSRFLGRAAEDAPPGKATQSFKSLIRVKNGEMILLGGLDELNNENSGTGTPFLSRIPVIKWFFSGRVKRKTKSKLHLFIKPTVTY